MAGVIDLNAIAGEVLVEIRDHGTMHRPVYRPDLRSEAQANAMPGLPLVYIWNEVVEDGQLTGYSLSVNGSIVGALLERRLPRSHPDFARLRDLIMGVIEGSSGEAVLQACVTTQERPSRLFGQPGPGRQDLIDW